MDNKPSIHCTYCGSVIEDWQSFRLHLVWYTRIHNVCWHNWMTDLEFDVACPITTAERRARASADLLRIPALYSAAMVKPLNVNLAPVMP